MKGIIKLIKQMSPGQKVLLKAIAIIVIVMTGQLYALAAFIVSNLVYDGFKLLQKG